MRTIHDLYKQYNLMPQLIEHQLRVGGIVKLLTDDSDAILTALIHDMGNMAKFTLDNPLMPIDNLEYWQSEQKKFWERYGREAHAATEKILREAGLIKYIEYLSEESRAYDLTQKDEAFFAGMSKPALYTLYADLRVGPHGVVTTEERIIDLEKRYGKPRIENAWGKVLESYIDKVSLRNGESIIEEDVKPLFDQLLTMTV